jgi:hypothetical protein
MPRFSERLGVRAQPRHIQIDFVDDVLRNSLWNSIYSRFHMRGVNDHARWDEVARALATYHYKVPVDDLPGNETGRYEWVRSRFFNEDWAGVYDIVEFLVGNVDSILNPRRERYYGSEYTPFLNDINTVLERELSGYRFIRGVLSPVTDPVEVSAIDAAASHLSAGGLAAPSQHIRAALELLGKRPTPDYRNSVKESISAVEAVVSQIAGTGPGGVAKAIETVAAKVEVHPALRAALKQLYGYTSDAEGIRHAILEQSTVRYDEAKFMLVACSAFVNFLVAKADSAGVLPERLGTRVTVEARDMGYS